MEGVVRVDHFGATVSDMTRSLTFWRDLLGLEVVGRGVVEWPHLDRLVALTGTRIEWVELQMPNGARVELSQYHHPVGEAVVSGEENEPGRSHLSLLVGDIVTMFERLRREGVRTRTPALVELEVGAYAGRRAIYVFDPDGIEIELIEQASGPTARSDV